MQFLKAYKVVNVFLGISEIVINIVSLTVLFIKSKAVIQILSNIS